MTTASRPVAWLVRWPGQEATVAATRRGHFADPGVLGCRRLRSARPAGRRYRRPVRPAWRPRDTVPPRSDDELVLHLHGLEDDDRRSRRDRVPDRDQHLDDLAGDRRADRLAARSAPRAARPDASRRWSASSTWSIASLAPTDAAIPLRRLSRSTTKLLAIEHERPRAGPDRARIDLARLAIDRDREIVRLGAALRRTTVRSRPSAVTISSRFMCGLLICYPLLSVPSLARRLARAPDPGLRRLRRRGQDHDRRGPRAGGRPARQAHAGPDDRSGASGSRTRSASRRSATRSRRSPRQLVRAGAPSDKRRAARDDARSEDGVRRGRRSATRRIPRRSSASSRTRSTPRSPARWRARRSTRRWPSSTTSIARGQWDLIVVDTPPTAHALDFLDAPRKLSEAIDSPAIEWFRKLQGGSGSRLVDRRQDRRVRAQAPREVRRLAVHRRHGRVLHRVQRHPRRLPHSAPRRRSRCCASRASASCSSRRPSRWRCARRCSSTSACVTAKMPFVGFVVNKIHPALPISARRQRDRRGARRRACRGRARPLGHDAHDRRAGAATPRTASSRRSPRRTAARSASCATAGGARAVLVEVPLLRDDVHDVDRLVGLERYLLAS